MAPTVTLALVPDTRAVARWAETGPGRTPGTVLVDVAPTKRPDLRDVAEAVLVGLGKDERLTAQKRLGVPLATGWLSLGERTEAVVLDAGALSDGLLAEMLGWFGGLSVDTWLLFAVGPECDHDALGDRIDALAANWGAAVVDHDGVKAHWPARRTPAAQTVAELELPILPRVDGRVFREALRADLDDATFARIDGQCGSLVRGLRAEVSAFTGTHKSRKFENLLRNRMHDTGPTEELHLLVRAAQIAGLVEGYNVSVDSVAFFGGCIGVPRRGQGVEQGWWTHLDAYRDPDVGATAAMYLAGLAPEHLVGLTAADVEGQGDGTVTVAVPGEEAPIVVSEPGSRFVRVLVAWRVAAGAEPSDRLFTTHRKAEVSYSHVSTMLRTPNEVGVRYAASPIRKVNPNVQTWLLRYGITISKLSYTAVGP